MAPYAGIYPSKDRSLAAILEAIGGFFGFMGLGWLYAGQVGKGLTFLIGYWVYLIVAGLLSTITMGFGLCIFLPISIGLLIYSVTSLNTFARYHTELFKP